MINLFPNAFLVRACHASNFLIGWVTGICLFFGTVANAQCDIEVSGVLAYCNAVHGNGSFPGFFIGFRIKTIDGDTLDVVDLAGNVPMNLGKRINNINNEFEPSDTSRVRARIAGGADSLEYWYFGPFMDGDSFNIVLIDPDGVCDTVEVASGTFTCAGQDPNACDEDVPLYSLDFSQSQWQIGGGGGVNENVDQVFLVMQRSRVATCCQTGNERCFEFIITLDDDDIGLLIDDVGNGSTGGHIYADSLNGFACGTTQQNTWPWFQDNGQSADEPLCLSGSAREWIVLSCKQGNNVTGVSIGTVGELNIYPAYVYEDCTVQLEVLNASSASWSSADDPNLDNLFGFAPDSLSVTFSYDEDTFGPVTSCDGDTFTYFIAGFPDNTCLGADSLLYDTTYVVVYPNFSIWIDSVCTGTDSILLNAILTSGAPSCGYSFIWSTGDTTQSIIVSDSTAQYSVEVVREDLDSLVIDCSPASDIIQVEERSILCLPDMVFECVSEPPQDSIELIGIAGCGVNPLVTSFDMSNNGSGCILDSLIITRYYVVDYDGDTINTLTDKDTCIQLFMYVDDKAPVISCPPNVTIGCTAATSPESTGGYATAVDNCDAFPVISYADAVTGGICPQEYIITRTWTATDDCGLTSTCNQRIAIEDNTPPAITCPANITIQCTDSTLPSNTGTATANDICDMLVITTYTDAFPAGACPQTIRRTWRATDDCGNSSTCLQIITLIDTQVPSATCPPDITISCLASTNPSNTGFATGTDNCDASLNISHTNSVVTGNCPQSLIITRTWNVSDDCGNLTTCVQIITTIDTVPPGLNCPADITIQCNTSTLPAQTGSGSATDNCDPLALVTYSDVTIGGTCPQEQTIFRTWVASDDCGNSSTCIQTIEVRDTSPPILTCPPNITIDCTENTLPGNTGYAAASDNCDASVTPAYTDNITTGDCPQEYAITRTWVAVDDCENASSCVQIINVIDQTAPVITCPADVTINYMDSSLPVNTGSATAIDNCDTIASITYTDALPSTCPGLNIISRTWVSTDDCGNSSSCIQEILIEDDGSICGSVEDDLGEMLDSVEIQLIVDANSNGIFDAGDTLINSVFTDTAGNYCFTNVKPCNYVIREIQPLDYGSLFDYDFTADPDGNDSLDGPDNEIPLVLAQGESDNDNNFIDIVCPTILPVIPPDTICDGGTVVFQTVPMNPGPLNYTWDFGSGSSPVSATGLGPHSVSYVTTTNNQMGGAIISLTVSKPGCPDLTGQVSTVDINPYPDPSINGSTANLCYFTNRTFQPVAPEIPGATYNWSFGNNAVPLTATGYGPHTVYYTVAGPKVVSLVIHPNEGGAQCPDSSTLSFNVTNCPGNITGTVKSVSGAGIQGVNLRLYADADQNGVADNNTIIRSVFTTANGSYSMVGLAPASFVIIQTQPQSWTTVDDEDTSDDGDPVPNVDSLDNLIPATLNPSEIDAHNNFIEIANPGSIHGTVFIDTDGDELPDSGEGIPGVTINVYEDDNLDGLPDSGTPLDTAITSSSGNYSFTNLVIGNYVLEEAPLAGYESVADFDATNDQDSVANTNTLDDLIPVTLLNQENDDHNYFIDNYECSLIVSNTNDSGLGSLRYMTGCAVDGDTIILDTSLCGQTIMLTSTKIEIDQDIVIFSDCVSRVTIGSSVPGLFDIGLNKHIEFHGLDLISGISGNEGAAFYNFGYLKLVNINILSNPLLSMSDILIRNTPGSELIIQGTCNLNVD